MNLNQAIVAKLKGKTVSCKNCRYWMSFYKVGSGVPSQFYCARNRETKTDTTMCRFFEGQSIIQPRHVLFINKHRVVFHTLMSKKSVHKAYRRWTSLTQ